MDATQSTYLRNQHTAIHEFGHTYGISHDPTVNCTTSGKWQRSVMYSNSYWVYENCGVIGPCGDDVAAANSIY
jgi:hypothetical protein